MECEQKTKTENDDKRETCIIRAERNTGGKCSRYSGMIEKPGKIKAGSS